MRKLIFFYLNLLVLQAVNAQTNNPAPYCLSGYTSTSIYPEISKVELIGPGWGPPNNSLVNTSTNTPAPGYTYYNNISTFTLIPIFATYTVKVTFKNVDQETMLKVWIDYNANLVFENGELIMSIPQGSVGTGMSVVQQNTFQINSSVPWFTQMRMRVSLGWHYQNWSTSTFSLNACHTPSLGDGSAGETEDYNVFNSYIEGVEELKNESAPQLFPNPSNSQVNVSEAFIEKIEHYELIDRLGRKIVSSVKFPIDVSELKSDLYFVRFYMKGGQTLNTKLQVD